MSQDSLNQDQREALIKHMVLGMYADGHLSLPEDSSLNRFIDTIGWDSGTGRTAFLTDAIHRASSLEGESGVTDYIRSCADCFVSGAEKDHALHHFSRFLQVDGISPDEAPLLSKFRRALGR